MAKRREPKKPTTEEMPPELETFTFEKWTDPMDLADFRPQQGEQEREPGVARAFHLIVKARSRWSEAKRQWRVAHGLEEERPLGMQVAMAKHEAERRQDFE